MAEPPAAEFRLLFEAMLDGCALHEIVLDDAGRPADYRFLAVNPAFEAAIGLPASQVVGRLVTEVLPATERKWIDIYGAIALGGPPQRFVERAKDLERWFEVAAYSPAHGRFVAIFRDITDRKRVEQLAEETSAASARTHAELAAAAAAHQEALQAKDHLLAVVSHELRTPLTGIIGMSELMGDTALDAEQRDMLTAIKLSGEVLLTVVNDILDHARLTAGRLEIRRRAFDLEATCEGAIEMLAARAVERGLVLGLRWHPDAPRRVVGDEGRVRQVLINLLGNALKVTTQGHVVVEVGALRVAEGLVRLRLAVIDSGPGLSRAQIGMLFRPFSQLEGWDLHGGQGGTGLGLAICKQLVDLMGGEIGVDSQPGQGALFWFSLPMPLDSAGQPPVADPALRGRRVMVVAGHELRRRLRSEQLAGLGLRVEAEATAGSALARVQAAAAAGDPYAVVVLEPESGDLTRESACRALSVDGTPRLCLLPIGMDAACRDCERARNLRVPARRSDLVQALAAACGAGGGT